MKYGHKAQLLPCHLDRDYGSSGAMLSLCYSCISISGYLFGSIWVHSKFVGAHNLCLMTDVSLCDLGGVDDIAASTDILGEIILYKPLRENIFVHFVMSTLYIYNNIIF